MAILKELNKSSRMKEKVTRKIDNNDPKIVAAEQDDSDEWETASEEEVDENEMDQNDEMMENQNDDESSAADDDESETEEAGPSELNGSDGEASDPNMDEENEESDDDSDSDVPDDNPDVDASDEASGDDGEEKSGWADAMAKVLGTGKAQADSKSLLLSKAKLDRDVAKASHKEGEDDDESGPTKPRDSYAVRKAKKMEKDNKCRSKPNPAKDRAREKQLAKLATKGVVQLFNAVREQQKTLKKDLKDAGGSFRKREKVYKNIDKEGFLEVLAGGKRKKTEKEGSSGSDLTSKKMKNETKEEPMEIKSEDEDNNGGSSWKILRDDFMMGAKMKDWDKDSDSEG